MAFTREIKVQLADAEIATKAKRLAEAQIELDAKKQLARDVAAGHRAEMKPLVEEIRELSQEVAHAEATVEVECFERHDVRRFCVEIVRRDNGEVIDERAMDLGEREQAMQPTLPGVPEPEPASDSPGWDDVAKASTATHGEVPKNGKKRRHTTTTV